MGSEPSAAISLSSVTIAYALLFYCAGLAVILRLAIEVRGFLDGRPGAGGWQAWLGARPAALRAAFFADPWRWGFTASLAAGLLAILARHLRYVLDPGWLGPLWPLFVLAQPAAYYGGLLFILGVAGLWWRRSAPLCSSCILVNSVLPVLLIVVPAAGYLLAPTDVMAARDFVGGLIRFHWRPLPGDPMLLIHFWLAAALAGALVLGLPGLLRGASGNSAALGRRRARLALAGLLGLLLAVCGGLTGQAGGQGGVAPARLPDLVRSHQFDGGAAMTRYHSSLLISHRKEVMHQELRVPEATLERCVTCHVVDPDGRAMTYDQPQHFCRSCHEKAAVAIDCFGCHNSGPIPDERAAPGQAMAAGGNREPLTR